MIVKQTHTHTMSDTQFEMDTHMHTHTLTHNDASLQGNFSFSHLPLSYSKP